MNVGTHLLVILVHPDTLDLLPHVVQGLDPAVMSVTHLLQGEGTQGESEVFSTLPCHDLCAISSS